MSQCRSPKCRARIIWRTSPTGAKLCLDAEPVTPEQWAADARHTYVLLADGQTATSAADPTSTLAGVAIYRSHWVTCIDRDRFK